VPRVQRHVERVWVLEGGRLALVDQRVHVDPEIAQQPIADVRMGELVLDDRDRGAEVVERRRVARGAQVGGGADQLGVGGDGEDAPDALQVLRRHVPEPFDELPRGEPLADLVLRPRS
jgi:hypothetical protein